MRRLLVHWLVIAASLALAAYLVPGVRVRGIVALAVGSLVLGLINALVRPVVSFFALPITIATLGLFYLVINACCFALAAWLVPGFTSHGILPSVLGALVVSVASLVLNAILPDERKRSKKKRQDRSGRR